MSIPNMSLAFHSSIFFQLIYQMFSFTEVSKAVEEAITSDEFVISMRNVRQLVSRRKKTETLFSLEFPGTHQKFSLQLDRDNKRGKLPKFLFFPLALYLCFLVYSPIQFRRYKPVVHHKGVFWGNFCKNYWEKISNFVYFFESWCLRKQWWYFTSWRSLMSSLSLTEWCSRSHRCTPIIRNRWSNLVFNNIEIEFKDEEMKKKNICVGIENRVR